MRRKLAVLLKIVVLPSGSRGSQARKRLQTFDIQIADAKENFYRPFPRLGSLKLGESIETFAGL